MALALVGLLVAAPQQVAGPFSPLALNLLIVVLAAVGLLSLPDLPSRATACAAAQRNGKGDRPVTSIYQRALGSDFKRLHPRIQERFGITSAGGRAAIGKGTIENVWHGQEDD